MGPGTRQRVVVVVLVAITAAFCWGLGWIAWGFVRSGGVVGWGLALATLILLGLTVWVTWREVLFGMASAELARQAPRLQVEADARTEFERARTQAESTPEDWRAWFRLSMAYEALRDRRHARDAMGRAITLERAQR